ncbi:MAG: CehA/McbA family metallohydrolase, partial [Thermoanaerobaculia bacterium]
LAVDGDGDGIRGLLAESPALEVLAGPPRQAILTVPSVVRPGATAELRLALVDALGNAGHPFVGTLELVARALPCAADDPDLACDPAAKLALPSGVTLAAGDRGSIAVQLIAPERGVFLIDAVGPEGLAGRSNPLVVSATLPRLLWGDLHGHSQLSDGTGTPADYFRYARDIAALDVVALTDHDHWGLQPLALHPELWREIRDEVERFHDSGRFVTLLGYEWTSWLYGHRHVLYFAGDGEVLSSVDPATETPQQLWDALRGEPALTFAHHSAGGPIATDWTIPPDPELEPVTEIVSVHGSSEAEDSPAPIYDPMPGNFVRDVLDRGYVLGFIGSGDSHDGHPGLAGLAAPSGGLAALWATELTREGVLEALRARRVYATNGPRILLQVALDGEPDGATVAPRAAGALEVLVVAPEILERLDVVRTGELIDSASLDSRVHRLRWTLHDLAAGEAVYVRAVQRDGGAAWSSPFFVR